MDVPRHRVAPGLVVHCRPREPIELELPSAGTTGFGWEIEPGAAVDLLGHSRVASRAAFGAAGTDVFAVRPRHDGRHILHFALKAPWEPGPARTIDVTLDCAER